MEQDGRKRLAEFGEESAVTAEELKYLNIETTDIDHDTGEEQQPSICGLFDRAEADSTGEID
jgi:hypothetical protein